MQNKLFKKSSMERIASPEKLNDYIQVANPASWMVIIAALALLLGMLAWGLLGQLSESVTFQGYIRDGELHCYAPGSLAKVLKAGMEAELRPFGGDDEGTYAGVITHVADQPKSYDEAVKDIRSDYLQSVLGISGWNIEVVVDTDAQLYDGMVYVISVVTDTYRPIELVFQ